MFLPFCMHLMLISQGIVFNCAQKVTCVQHNFSLLNDQCPDYISDIECMIKHKVANLFVVRNSSITRPKNESRTLHNNGKTSVFWKLLK